jgi:hypothetical protein
MIEKFGYGFSCEAVIPELRNINDVLEIRSAEELR